MANVYYIGKSIYPPIEDIPYSPDDFRERRLNQIPIEERVGQMLMVAFNGTEINNELIDFIITNKPGGVILFGGTPSVSGNILSKDQLTQLISDLQEASEVPMFVAADVEGGVVNRLQTIYKRLPSAETMGQGETDETRRIASELGAFMNEVGINLNLAPVVDLDLNSENPIIGGKDRAFSSNPIDASAHALSFITGLHDHNIISAIKHFPGHGSSADDTHLGTTDITSTYDKNAELLPYETLFDNRYDDMVMTAHITHQDFDDVPATLSSVFINQWLRRELGYDGVVISDDMLMGAIVKEYTLEKAVLMSIDAGVDIILLSAQYDDEGDLVAGEVIDTILEAVEEGEISTKRINKSYTRIMDLKKRYGLVKS